MEIPQQGKLQVKTGALACATERRRGKDYHMKRILIGSDLFTITKQLVLPFGNASL